MAARRAAGATREARVAAAAVAATGLLPLAVGAVALAVRFVPAPVAYGDGALIDLAVREAAALERLLGPYSRFGWHHPGPAMFYWLAPFSRLAGGQPAGLMVGALVANSATMAATVAVVVRSAGRRAAVPAAAVVLLLAATLGVDHLLSFWNAQLVVLPLVLVGVLTAAAAAGSGTALAAAALVGSAVVQTHVGTAGLLVAWLVTAAVALLWARARGGARDRWRPQVAAALAAATVVVWLPVVVEQATVRPGNVAELATEAGTVEQGQGLREAGAAVSATATTVVAGLPPRGELRPAAWRWMLLGVLLAATAVVTVVAWRRRATTAAAAGLLALVGTAACWLSATRFPGPIYRYLVLWAVAPTTLGLIAIAAALRPRPLVTRAAVGVVLVMALALAVQAPLPCERLVLTGLGGPSSACASASERTRHHVVAEAVDLLAGRAELRRPRTVRLAGEWWLAAGVAADLTAAGHDVRVAEPLVVVFGRHRAARGDEEVSLRILPAASSGRPSGAYERLGRAGGHVLYLRADGVVAGRRFERSAAVHTAPRAPGR